MIQTLHLAAVTFCKDFGKISVKYKASKVWNDCPRTGWAKLNGASLHFLLVKSERIYKMK